MLEKNKRIRAWASSLLDAVLLFAAYLLANHLRFNYVRYFQPGGAGPALDIAQDTVYAGALYAVGAVAVFWLCGLYDASRLRGFWRRCRLILWVNAACILGFEALLYQFRVVNFSRLVVGMFYLFGTGLLIFKRLVRRFYDRWRHRHGEDFHHVLLVGGGKMAAQYLLALEHNPYYGYYVDGYLANTSNESLKARYLGSYRQLDKVLASPDIEEVVIALDADEMEMIPRALAACDKQGLRITMVPFYNDYLPARPTIDVVGSCKLINVRQTPFDNILNAFAKRLFDILGSLVLIVLTSPVMLAVAIGVKLSSPGPVIFRQKRVGLNKKEFMMYKFRSMRTNGDEKTGWSTNTDPRKTRFGSFIRKFSLDELPQFFNVLKGDMSLVGTRPPTLDEYNQYESHHKRRLSMKPGITGMWQVSGRSNIEDFEDVVKLDVAYIDHWSIWLDIKILLKTVLVVFGHVGAK